MSAPSLTLLSWISPSPCPVLNPPKCLTLSSSDVQPLSLSTITMVTSTQASDAFTTQSACVSAKCCPIYAQDDLFCGKEVRRARWDVKGRGPTSAAAAKGYFFRCGQSLLCQSSLNLLRLPATLGEMCRSVSQVPRKGQSIVLCNVQEVVQGAIPWEQLRAQEHSYQQPLSVPFPSNLAGVSPLITSRHPCPSISIQSVPGEKHP